MPSWHFYVDFFFFFFKFASSLQHLLFVSRPINRSFTASLWQQESCDQLLAVHQLNCRTIKQSVARGQLGKFDANKSTVDDEALNLKDSVFPTALKDMQVILYAFSQRILLQTHVGFGLMSVLIVQIFLCNIQQCDRENVAQTWCGVPERVSAAASNFMMRTWWCLSSVCLLRLLLLLLLLLLSSVALPEDTTGGRQPLLKLPTHPDLPQGAQPITKVPSTQ